jgi:hypothetical protein
MTSRTRMWVGLVAFGLIAGFVQGAVAADAKVAGTWTWTQKRNDQEMKMTLKVKQEGDKLTGDIESPRGKTDISDGTVKEGVVSFHVVREFNGNKMDFHYTGKVDGDSLKLKVEWEREGEKQSRDVEAKRETEKS